MFNVLLCIPPDYEYNFPPLGTPALAAFLKHHGVATQQQDLNLGYRRFLIGHLKHPSLSLKQKKAFLPALLKKFFYENLRGRYYSKYLLRSKEKNLPLLPYDNNTSTSFYFTERLLSSPQLERYLGDEGENTFLQYYRAIRFADLLEKEGISLLGLSVISPSQAIPSLTLGYLLKKTMPQLRVVLGGPWVTLYRWALWSQKAFFKYFDAFITFEGETPLLALAAALERRETARSIVQVIHRDSASQELDHFIEEDLDKLPCPDFDGLPLKDYNEYTSDGPALTYETSRGCYWSKCAYCVDLPLPKPTYRFKDPELVVRDIRELAAKYAARSLMMGDPGMSARQMSQVSDAILKSNTKIGWWCMARLDGGFRRPLFEKAHKAGLWQANFGFESASDRVCEYVHKGNLQERSSRVIKDCHAAGILVDVQTMLGLPTETWEEGLQTIDFLVSHKEYIAHVSFNIFYLTPENFIFRDPEKYGILVDKKKILPFGFFLPFKNEKGLSNKEAYLLQKLYASLTQSQGSSKTEALKEDSRLILSEGVMEDEIVLCLNGEESRLHFLNNVKSRELSLYDDAYHDMMAQFKKGARLADIRRKWARRFGEEEAQECLSFAVEALERGFLKYA